MALLRRLGKVSYNTEEIIEILWKSEMEIKLKRLISFSFSAESSNEIKQGFCNDKKNREATEKNGF